MPDGTEPIVGASDYSHAVHLEPWTEYEDVGFAVQLSAEHIVLEDHWVPAVLRFKTTAQEPQIYFEINVTDAGPKLVEFAFVSRDPDSSGIRQADFRELQVSAIVEDFLALWIVRIDRDEAGAVVQAVSAADDYTGMTRFAGRLRAGKSREITPQLLQRVAHVYRENIAGHPTKAVQHHFQVSQRMAAEYVSMARQRKLLPPTKRGKKNA